MSKKVSEEVANRCRELAKVLEKSRCKFHMGIYIDGISTYPAKAVYDKAINKCDTSASVVGHIPSSHPECIVYMYYRKGKVITLRETSLKFLDLKYAHTLWCFLFAGSWYNNKEQAIKRLLYVADNREVHPDFIVGEDEYNWELVLE